MQLKSLELIGFKSFPDRTLINFSDGITAIIGPNGSGKSNIADAVRWVMGETSAKTLRGNKTEDVIFDGTQSRKPLGFAEVTLTLLNSDGALAVPYEEVALTRRYYRSGDSEYFINRKPVRLKDIQELLRDTGLGKTGYSIIGQGTVTEIITSKSTDRRHFFEEAAGIAGFKYKKEESARKLALTSENLVRLTDILTELSDRLGPLGKQAEKAKKYLALYEEKKVLELSVWLDGLKQTEAEIKKAAETAESIRSSLSAVDVGVQEYEDRSERLGADIRDLTVEIEKLREKISEYEQQCRDRDSEILLLGNDIEHGQRDIERIRTELSDDDSVREALKKEIEEKTRQLLLAEKQAAELAEDISGAESEREAQRAEGEEAAKKSRSLADEAEALTAQITAMQLRVSGADGRKAGLVRKLEETEKELSDAAERLASLEKTGENAENELEALAQKRRSLENMLGGYALKKNSRQDRCEKLRRELNEKTLKLRQTQDRRRMLEDMEKHYEGFSGSVKSVMTEAEKGVLHGVCGTVAGVIKTDREYSVAVETALGAAIQNIITETEKDAKNCISLLKSRNLGRATFLPLDTVRPKVLDTRNFASMPGFRGLASQIITCDDRYRGVIESLLGRTAVAETLDDATRIARSSGYSFRLVTLDGQVVNAGGSLTGGSVGKNVGILSRANEAEALAETEKKLAEEAETADKELRNALSELNMLTAQVDGINAEIKTVDDEQVKRKAELDYCTLYITNIREQMRSLQDNISRAKEDLDGERADLAKTEGLISEKTAQLEKIKWDLRSAEDENGHILENLERIREEIYAKEVRRVEYAKNGESLRLNIEQLNQRLEQGTLSSAKRLEQISEIEARNVEYTRRISDLKEENSSLRTLEKECSEHIADTTSRRDGLEAEKNRIFEGEKKLFEQKEKLAREAERMQIRQATLRNDSDTVIAKIWDEYEMTLSEAQAGGFTAGMPFEEAKKRVAELRASIKALGSVNVEAIDEFAEVRKRHDELREQTEDLTKSRDELTGIIADLEEEMKKIFAESFKAINEEFSRVFRELFNGGSARLELTDGENLLESGIEIYVAPPGKIIKHLSSLSGGEQSLTAIALYFALLHMRPSPFCLLDEIESALDDVNVVRYARYLSNLSHKTQFLLITHRRGTMEIADRLYGVTMREKGVSKMLTINVKDIADEQL